MTEEPPTITQQRALAYAPKPFAVLSFLSSSYVIYHLLRKQPKKLKRMYHRLVLAMNISVLPHSFSYFWGTWAVPEGTPYYVGASGNVNTCTAQGFIKIVFLLVVPAYYASLSVHSYIAIKNNFKEEKYKWLEIVIHLGAYTIALAFASVLAATENINPNGSGCFGTGLPRGCETDPNVPCQRGSVDLTFYSFALGLSQIILYYIIPPLALLLLRFRIIRAGKKIRTSKGMNRIRESARKQMMRDVAVQISVYLFSFWFTYIFNVAHLIYRKVTGKMMYNLVIFGNSLVASQGAIISIVYFTLQRIARVKQEIRSTTDGRRNPNVVTVAEIRDNAKSKDNNPQTAGDDAERQSRQSFNIFDGTPDQDSPWAMFIDHDDYEDVDVDAAKPEGSSSVGVTVP